MSFSALSAKNDGVIGSTMWCNFQCRNSYIDVVRKMYTTLFVIYFLGLCKELKLHMHTIRKQIILISFQYVVCLCYLSVFISKFSVECHELLLLQDLYDCFACK